ncbi:Retrovirus-related Pol polyprotein from type-1 retrotransposable element R1 [Eumeta japonica]|uniref:Retrovirus-related Pol polyprotein from type-1 retrotransposable element R1 n=1 Tax=Eumeta variegata TaxID=151549 RepID=A0A4C1ZTN7_EUMVA|nr:Retrovirus-related Pol polyprotein from type-1 retrotransposable element R1 [Eumeta japonica]
MSQGGRGLGRWQRKIVSQKIMTTPPVPCTPPETAGDGAKYSHEKRVRGTEDVPNDGTVAAGAPPAKLVVEVESADAAVAAARESDVGVFTALEAVGDFARRASLKDEIGRPSLPASRRPTPVDLSGGTPRPEPRDSRSVRLDAHPIGRLASSIGTLAMEARGELECLRNISRDVKESVIGKLAAISELALCLEESRSSYIMELERERARRAKEAEAAEKRIAKIAKENLEKILQIENKIDKMAGEVSSTRNLLGHFDVPEKLEAIQKTLEAGIAPRVPNYAEVAAKPKPVDAALKRIPGPEIRTGAGHTLIISSRIENHTAEQVFTKLRSVVDAREMGVAVDRLRKARNQKVVVSCSSAEDAKKIEERLKMRGADLRVSKPEKRLPTVVIRDVLRVNTDEDVVRSLRTQNKHITEGLNWDKQRAKVCYRRRARNNLECHPVLEVTPELYQRLMEAGYVYVGLQRRPVCDQSPLVQCSRCLGFGHGKQYCKDVSDKCAHCGGDHMVAKCQTRSAGCRVIQKATPRRGPVKAAIIVLDSGVDVEEDQTLIDENVTAAVIVAGNYRIGVVSVYFEGDIPIGPYLDRVRYVCSKLGTDKIILGSNVNAWSVCWGSEHDDACRVDLCDFFDAEGLHILNEGNTPTFKVYRGDRLFRSVVNVTSCGSALLDRVEEWQVVRDVTSSDHNAVTFAVRMGKRSGPRPPTGTQVYNTAKARWSEFGAAMDAALIERALTLEMVESVDSCDRLDGIVETYTECIRQACETAIPLRNSKRRLKLPWWSPELEGLKKDALTKKRRIRNAAPSRREYVVGEYVQARESLWDGIYRVIRETGKNREDVLLQTDSGLVLSPNESATLLAETFFPDDQVDTDYSHHAEVRRQTDGDDRPPETSGDLPGVDPPFTGAEVKNALKAFHPRKAPGIDGFTSDICQAAIFRDLGVFLAMANKCLELGYFPRAWKVAAIKVIPKPGKDDYARPNS